MLMWAFSADVWDFQLRNGGSKFPCRFVMPYAILPLCVGYAAARAVHKHVVRVVSCLLTAATPHQWRSLSVCLLAQVEASSKREVAKAAAVGAFTVTTFIASLPIVTLVLKVE